jgi:hypothetical protein
MGTPHYLDYRLTDGDEILSLAHWPRSDIQEHSLISVYCTHFCWRPRKQSPGRSADGRIE